jgi:hypothetical protein
VLCHVRLVTQALTQKRNGDRRGHRRRRPQAPQKGLRPKLSPDVGSGLSPP